MLHLHMTCILTMLWLKKISALKKPLTGKPVQFRIISEERVFIIRLREQAQLNGITILYMKPANPLKTFWNIKRTLKPGNMTMKARMKAAAHPQKIRTRKNKTKTCHRAKIMKMLISANIHHGRFLLLTPIR